MRILGKSLAVLAMVWASGASATEGGYFGGVAGLMTPDEVDGVDVDNPFNAGIRGGYTWASGFGVEAEYTTSVVDGELKVDNGFINFSTDFSISTLGLYATYRSQGDIYFKAKLGYLNEDISSNIGGGDDTDVSLGAGVGFSLSENVNLEAEYTQIEDEVDFWSGTLAFRF